MNMIGIIKNSTTTYSIKIILYLPIRIENLDASQIGIFFNTVNTVIPKILNNRWEKAICIATIFPVENDARRAVTAVPILAPRVYGYIWFSVKIPAPARGIMRAVLIELLCTNAVIIKPSNNEREYVRKIY